MAAKRPRATIFARIAKEAILISAGVSLLLFVSFWLGSFAEDVASESTRIKNEIGQKTAENQSLQAKMTQFGNALPIWTSIRDKDGKYKLNLSRDEATNIFIELRDAYGFKDVRVTVAPIRVSIEPGLVRTKMQVMESDININMRAYTDEQVVQFLEDVKQKLPGIIKVNTFRMSRSPELQRGNADPNASAAAEGELSEERIIALKQPQIDASISLLWYGIGDVAPPPGATPGAPPGAIPGMPGAMR